MIRSREPAFRRLQEEVARDPGNRAFVSLADLYREQGRLEIARRVCIRGLERQPNNVEAHYVLGRIYRDAEDPEKAYDEWDIALRLDPMDVASRRAIAFLCLERGELDEAGRHLRKALENDPDDPRIRRALRFVENGGRQVTPDSAYWEGVAEILKPRSDRFIRESRVRLLLVIDGSGRVVSQQGFTRDLDIAAFATLAAGVNAAAAELARMSDQPPFSQLYQGRGDHQIFIGSIPAPAGDLLLLCVFGEDTTIGLVRVLFSELVDDLAGVQWPRLASADLPVEDLETELATRLSIAAPEAINANGRNAGPGSSRNVVAGSRRNAVTGTSRGRTV